MRALLIVLVAVVAASGCTDANAPSTRPAPPVSTTRALTTSKSAARPHEQSQAVVDARRGAALVRLGHVIDGDTLALAGGARVRLAQIDTPEKYGHAECYGARASVRLTQFIPSGSRLRLVRDPALDDRDRYGRLVRYVYAGSTNVNVAMVRAGAASVWFYEGVEGAYSRDLLRAVRSARRAQRGVWGACPEATFDPYHGFSSGSFGSRDVGDAVRGAQAISATGRLPVAPPFPPDVDCSDLAGPVRVTRDDPHNLDRDGDGIGCDS